MALAFVYGLIGISAILALLVVRGLRIRGAWLLLWGISPVLAVYLLNPGFRIHSFHSFMHAGIVYQILNRGLPPPDPLLAGLAARYPWGAHLVAAAISRVANTTPLMSFAVLNVGCLVAAMILIYRTSQRLRRDWTANTLAVVISIFGTTMLTPEVYGALPGAFPSEIRGIPLLHKFITINNMPVGLVCFALALYMAVRLFQQRRFALNTVVLTAAILASGFLYPALLPGVLASSLAGCAVALAATRGRADKISLIRALAVLGLVGMVLIVLRPYLMATGGGTVAAMELLRPRNVGLNLVKLLGVALPVLVMAAVCGRHLLSSLERKGFAVVATVAAASAGAYIAVHLPLDNEYKLLLMATLALGILGGHALAAIGRRRRWLAWMLVVLLLVPGFRVTYIRVARGSGLAGPYIEHGRRVESSDPQRQQLYDWILAETRPDAVFIDRELDIPVLGQRALLVAAPAMGRDERKGFGLIGAIMEAQSGYERELLDGRRQVVTNAYGRGRELEEDDWEVLRSAGGNAYAVARSDDQAFALEAKGFAPAFKASGGLPAVYRMVPGRHWSD
jgi:hypothetical protein